MSLYPPTQHAFPSLGGAYTVDSWWRWTCPEKWAAFHVLWNMSSTLPITGTSITDALQAHVQPAVLGIMSSDCKLDSIYVSCWLGGACVRQYSVNVGLSGSRVNHYVASAMCASLTRRIFPAGRGYTSKIYTPPPPIPFFHLDSWTPRGINFYNTLLTVLNNGFGLFGGTFAPIAYSYKHNALIGHLPYELAPRPTWLYRHRPRGAGHNRFPTFPVI